MTKLLAVGLGGFVGAIARYGISTVVQRQMGPSLPYGTLAVNVLGCLLIGVLMSLVETREALSPNARLVLIVGMLGSLTTFSTLGYETFELLRRSLPLALGNVAVNAVIGVAALALGRLGARALWP